jgi:D-alanyl-D-alanine carboxypeptidase
MIERRPDWEAPDDHRIVAFIATALLILGSLLLVARLVPGESQAADLAARSAAFASERGEGAPSVLVAPPVAPSEDTAVVTPVQEAPSQPQPAVEAAPQGESTPETAAEAPPQPTTEVAPPSPPAPAPLPEPPPRIEPASPPPAVGARSFAVIERSCGAFLAGKAEHERLPPASVTKIITALVVARYAQGNEMVDVNVSGSQMARRGSSVMGIEPNMTLSVTDLLYGLILPSGNDAALALAEHVGHGNVAAFVDLMNAESGILGLHDTHFSNPHGLDDARLYSSALDMAQAGRAYLDNPMLARIASVAEYMPAWNGPSLKNGNRLLERYPGSYGVKIGYTRQASQTIVAAASRDGRELIVSVFGSPDRYKDTAALLDWAFANIPAGACR